MPQQTKQFINNWETISGECNIEETPCCQLQQCDCARQAWVLTLQNRLAHFDPHHTFFITLYSSQWYKAYGEDLTIKQLRASYQKMWNVVKGNDWKSVGGFDFQLLHYTPSDTMQWQPHLHLYLQTQQTKAQVTTALQRKWKNFRGVHVQMVNQWPPHAGYLLKKTNNMRLRQNNGNGMENHKLHLGRNQRNSLELAIKGVGWGSLVWIQG